MGRIESVPGLQDSVALQSQRLEDSVNRLLLENNLRAILAISGGAEEESLDSTCQIISDLIINTKDIPVAILTGGTKGGVPEIGIQIARKSSVPTIGVYPPQGRQHALLNDLDIAIETLPPLFGRAGFGTETPTFINLANGIAVIGGGFGTLTEVSAACKINVDRNKKQESPIYICPISGTGGVADIIQSLPGMERIKNSFPTTSINNGKDAAKFFRANLTPVSGRE
jgi:predicted Rossmann-fold nucleotide-binding protein